ncbi:hypothetical protein LCL96_15235 [Rossellomorea aquimaris]|uniref:hypothetical protein n=1 Tax=Rossellomorea aquimaris TaxID=189382 RepID=UPI001CD55A3D|nr:hypothetical protein [Rossellomorea aquimaris]MCA1060291.1 hypothetical protein [Rossellomorea aquimaris]
MIEDSAIQVPTNWRSNIDQVVAGYETEPAKGLVHGLQKDGLQNMWGAKNNRKGTNWGAKFQLIENDMGTFLAMEDWGTTGMTGPNIPMDQINRMSGDLHPDYKLARFSAMNYSGGNEGAGLFGRGKLLFSAASKDYNFFFETLTEEEGYRANYKMLEGNILNVGKVAYEGERAHSFIRDNTGIDPINRVGSRIIIANPKDEIVTAIKNGDFKKDIEETWWRIILKYNATILIEYNGMTEKAEVPSEYKDALEEKNGWKAWKKSSFMVPGYYEVKRIQLFVSESEISEELRGVSFYRRDMKIGKIDLDIPAKIQKKYFGFIEVDRDWEKELAENENLEHYGVKNKSKKCFQKIKFEVSNEHKAFMEELGLFKKQRSEDERLRQELTEISQGLDSFLNTMNIDAVGNRGTKKNKIELSWAGMDFPSNRDNKQLFTGDQIKNIKFKIKNNLGSTKKVQYKLNVLCQNREVKNIATSIKDIQGSTEETFGPFDLLIDAPLVKFEKNILNLEVVCAGKQINKQIPLYYDLTPVTVSGHPFLVQNSSISFPHQESKRVNTNESLKDIKYTIENNTTDKAFIAFHLTTHNAEQSNELIESVYLNRDIVLNAFEKIEIKCPDILFLQDIYESKLDKGKVELRARISAAQDFSAYETAQELSKGSKISFYFNQDPEGSGSTFSDFRSFADENGKRSDVNNLDGNWVFDLYIKHPAYERVMEDEENRKEYLAEEMLKQMVRAHIQEGNYSILNVDGNEQEDKDFEELPPAELMQKIYFALDNLQFKRLKL